MNDEEAFTRPRSQTFSRSAGFHATFESKRIWRINSFIPARSGWPFSTWFPLHEHQDRPRAFSYATTPAGSFKKCSILNGFRNLGLLIICRIETSAVVSSALPFC